MNWKKTALFSAILLTAVQAQANQTGTVDHIDITANRYLIYLTGTKTSHPSCDCCNRWEVDASTTTGQSYIATVLTAFSLHRTVVMNSLGTPACVAGSNDTEAIGLIQMQ